MDPSLSDPVSLGEEALTSPVPRSGRVHLSGKPSLPSLTTTTSSSDLPIPSSPPPPILPTRSPLRPPARSISSSSSTTGTPLTTAFPSAPLASSSSSSLPQASTSTSGPDVATTTTQEDELDANDRTLTKHSIALAAAAVNSSSPISQMSLMRERHNSFPSINGLIDALSAEIEGVEGDEAKQRVERDSIITWEADPSRRSSTSSISSSSFMSWANDAVHGQPHQSHNQHHQHLDLSLSFTFNQEKSLPPRPLDITLEREGYGAKYRPQEDGEDGESPISLADLEAEDSIGRPNANNGPEITSFATTSKAAPQDSFTMSTSNRSSANSDSNSTSATTSSHISTTSTASTTLTSVSSSSNSLPTTTSTNATSTIAPPQPPPMTKRQHALHELLSSERAYASDLALLREVHIPLALGQTAPIHPAPAPTSAASTSSPQSANSNSNSTANAASSSATSTCTPGSGSGSNGSSRAVSTFSAASDPTTGNTSAATATAASVQRISTSSSSASSSISGGSGNNHNHNHNHKNGHTSNNSVSSLPVSISASISTSSFTGSLGSGATSSGIWSLGPPMTPEDVKVIFGNIADLAMLADMLCEELEHALGNVLEGGVGEDYVGELFLKVIPEFEKPYKQYITRHSTALQHLQNLPQTPALQAYLSYTQSVASSVSHAWDLASLLIKPVQRLLKYPLLLTAILEETPNEHGDKEKLKLARTRIEELARDVNEGRRRAEVVKDVLSAGSGSGGGGGSGLLGGLKGPGRKSSASGASGGGAGVQHPVGVAASVNLSKVKSLKYGGVTAATMRAESASLLSGSGDGPGASGSGAAAVNAEAVLVDAMAGELKRMEVFAQQFAKNVVDWGKMMSNVTLALRTWALSFGKVIGLSAEQGLGSEAFDAFVEVIRKGLMPLTADLEAAINERLLKDLAHLLTTMNKPLKLLASMSEQEPYHYHLLTMPVSSKNRPPASLLAASTNYLALRGQLAAELPIYLKLMHRGFAVIVRRLAQVQVRFWRDVKERWADLWEMLRVEGELNVGWEETCAVWCARWGDVDELVAALGITQKPVLHTEKSRGQLLLQGLENQYFAYPNYYVPMASGYPASSPPIPVAMPSPPISSSKENHKLEKKASKSSNTSGRKHSIPNSTNAAAAVQSMFAALEPAHSPALQKTKQQQAQAVGGIHGNGSMFSVSAPLPLGSVAREKDRDREGKRGRVSDVTSNTQERDRRTSSQDSASRQRSSASRDAQRRRTQGHTGMADEYAEYVALHGGVMPPPYEGGQYPYNGGNGRGVTRMKSMPITASGHNSKSNGQSESYIVDSGDRAYHHHQQEGWEEYQESTRTARPTPRGRSSQDNVLVKPSPSTKRKSKERPTHERKRSGSVKSITSFFTGSSNNVNHTTPVDPQPLTPSQRDSWVSKPAKYICQVVHPCRPPDDVSYYSFPFFVLKEGDLYEVLQEAGHPSIHPQLPLYVDEGVDCLLLCRNGNGVVGWALASFLEPLDMCSI